MADRPEQSGPVAVYGATGYTGRLVASELERRGADFVLAGRNAGKLDALAARLGEDVPTAAVALEDGPGLRELLEPCAAVIACAGPFTAHGEPVLAAATDTGTHYVDTAGEQPFIELAFDAYGRRAESAGAIVVSAMGFDYAPGDMIAALTAAGIEKPDEVVVAYSVRRFEMSRGTMRSGLRIMGSGDVEYRDGAWRPASGSVDRGTFDFPPPVGPQRVIRYPSGEPITVPRHVPTRNVSSLFSAESVLPSSHLVRAAPVLMPAIQLAMRTPLRRAGELVIDRLPEGPDEEARRAARFMIVCEVRKGTTRRRGVVRGSDVYGLTAFTTAHGALLAASPGYERGGALAPSQAFDPGDFLTALAEYGVDHEVDPLPEPVQAREG
jgi:short subunit dehydrogenase-like uncharacterized protein